MVASSVALLTGCDSFDCSMENTVTLTLAFYNDKGEMVRLNDTLTVTAVGTDSVLFNRGVNRHDVVLPMSYYKDCDTLVLTVWGADYMVRDTLMVWKTNVENFEGLDCPVNMYHMITDVKATNGFIDSVAMVVPDVDYGKDENIRIILRSAE